MKSPLLEAEFAIAAVTGDAVQPPFETVTEPQPSDTELAQLLQETTAVQQPETASATPPERRKVGFARRTTVALTAATGLLLPMYHGETPPGTHSSPEVVTMAEDQNAINVVEKLLATPTNPDIVNVQQAITDRQVVYPNEAYSRSQNEVLYQTRKRQADKLGLTVFNPSAVLEAMDTDTFKNPLSVERSLDLANSFLKNYGLSIGFNKDADYNYGFVPTSEAAVIRDQDNSAHFKSIMDEVVKAVAALPKEYIDWLGVQHIYLATVKPGKNSDMVYAAFITQTLRRPYIAVNVKGTIDETAIWHELGHRAAWLTKDDSLFGDQTFEAAALNTPHGEVHRGVHKGYSEGYLTVLEFQGKRLAISNNFIPAEPDCMKKAEQTEQQIQALGQKTVYETDYSEWGDTWEQIAETIREEPNADNWSTMLSPLTPSIRKQFILVLARMFKAKPAITEYFIMMADRQIKPEDSSDYFANRCTEDALNPEQPGEIHKPTVHRRLP